MNFQRTRAGFGWLRNRERAEVAYHEAGHALVAAATWRRLSAATVESQAGALAGGPRVAGSVTVAGAVARPDAPPPRDGGRAFGLIVGAAFALGGPEAERLATGAVAGDECDREQADGLLTEAGRLLGVPDPWWRELLAGAVEVNLRENWERVEAVAAGLLDRRTLTGDELHALLGDRVAALDLTEVTAGIASLAGVDVSAARLSG